MMGYMFESSFRVEQDSTTGDSREKYQLDEYAEVEHLGVSENGVYYWRYNGYKVLNMYKHHGYNMDQKGDSSWD